MVDAGRHTGACVLQGMACVGRTKQCTLVPPNHFGPIPGVEVGSQWKFRVQVRDGLTLLSINCEC